MILFSSKGSNKITFCQFHTMFPIFYLGTVYQTMPSSLYEKRGSAVQTDSIDFTKTNKVTSNINQLESGKKLKITRVITSAPFAGKNRIHSSGTD